MNASLNALHTLSLHRVIIVTNMSAWMYINLVDLLSVSNEHLKSYMSLI